MGEAQQKFVKILNEIFEMDKSDLDFGIYRIMNVKRDLITDYTETKFPEKVQNILAEYKDNSHEKVKIDLAEAIKQAEALGADPDTLPKVKELKALLTDTRDFSDIENEVYNHLAIFFRRYYDKGDFISRRRYKGDTYAIPYSGEEVKLYWANADQYYIKTGEHYKDYVFKISDGRKVHFKIVEVEGEQKDNNKDDKKRFFVLRKEKPFTVENRELVLSFEYRNESVSGKNAQINLNKAAVEGFSKSELANDWKLLLEIVNPKDKKDKQQTFLQKQLYKYTARNSYDYFIHKDIKTFLQRELDFYIKNEVMFLDDIEYAKEVSLKQQLDQIRAIKAVGQDIIDFITQFEEFQKKLWLKKKFIVDSGYCVTLDYLPKDLLDDVVKNKEQWDEWKELGFYEKTPSNKPAWIKDNPFAVIDTKFYDKSFVKTLLSSIDDIDEKTDGLIINSENFQSLGLLQEKYREKIKCVYIDPPYNTGGDGFVYKDNYQHSSWLSSFNDKIDKTKSLSANDGVFFGSIDDNEILNMRSVLNESLGKDSFTTQIIIQSNKRGQTYQQIAKTHEYLVAYKLGENSEFFELPKEISENALKDDFGSYELWELRNRNPKFGKHNRPNLYYPIFINPTVIDENGYALVSLNKNEVFSIEVFPLNSQGYESCWRWGVDKVKEAIIGNQTSILLGKEKRDGGWNIYQKARKSSTKAKSIWNETSVINEQGTIEVGSMGLTDFGFPKPVLLIQKALVIGASSNRLILDYFAGSGTTGHAVINLNREDDGKRKYILVEMGSYFDSVLKKRLQKVVYSPNWKNGKAQDNKGSSHILKYFKMESYEDTLNNLELKTGELFDEGGDSFQEVM